MYRSIGSVGVNCILAFLVAFVLSLSVRLEIELGCMDLFGLGLGVH